MKTKNKSFKRLFAFLVALVMVTALVPSVIFAADPTFPDVPEGYWAYDYIEKLAAKDVIGGYPDGTFGPKNNVTRQQAAKMIAKAAGLEASEGFVSKFTDFDKVASDMKASVLAVEDNKVVGGFPDGSFGPTKNITRSQAAKMIVLAFGLAKGSNPVDFDDPVADATDQSYIDILASNGIVGGYKEGGKTLYKPANLLTREQLAKMIVEAMELELEILEVSAINAKTLKVDFNNAISEEDQAKATFDVKRGTIPTTVTAKWAEDGKSLELARGANLIAGDYTVTVTGLAEEALVGTVKVEAEKLTKINFLSDIAVISGNNVVATVTAENQYGELITSKLNTGNANISATTSKGTSVSIDNNGRLVVAGTSGLFKADDKLVVTIVDSTTGVTASKTLTVAQAAAVESIEIGELTTDDEALAKKPLNVANYDHTKFYIPVEVKDQYGNVLKAADLNGSVTVASSNKNIINPASTLFVDTNDGVILDLQAADSSQTHGTAVLTFVAAGTGKTANTSITILENYKLDVVTLEAPSTELKLGVETELPITIVNTYGDTVALKDVTGGGSSTALTLDGNTTITAIGANLAVVKDYVNDKSVLKITPSAKNITLTVVTATGKSQVLSLTASEAPVVSSIRGLNKNFVSVLANDISLNTNLSGAVEFSDQYGNKIAAPGFDAADGNAALDYTIKVKGTATATNLASGTITAKTTAGTDTYQVILKAADGTVLDTFDVTIKVVDKKDIKQFGIEDLDKFYTGGTSAAHDQQVVIYGLVNGQKVEVNQAMIADVSATNGLAIGTNGAYTAASKDTKDADVASIITVLVENTANGNTYELTQDVVYNSEAPKATSLVVEYDGVEVTSGVVGVPASEINSKVFTPHASASKLQFIAEDQYGVNLTSGYNVVATNVDAAGTISGSYTAGDLNGYAAGDSFQLNVRNGNFSKSVKVVVE